MAETFRAPKAVQEEASLNSGWEKITQPVDIHDVLAIRQSWQGENGRVWAEKIIDNLAVRAANARALSLMASKEGDMTEVSDLNEELTELLADIVSFYFRAHGAHWNVTGTDFAEYHALFNEIYEDVYGSIDPLAENLRKLGIKAPFTLPQFIALRTLDDSSTNSSDARVLATDLLAANDAIVNGIAEAFDSAQEANQQGIANFLADRLDKHQFWKWQLTASLGEEVANPTPVEPAEDIAEEGVETDESTYPMPIAGRSASGASDLPLADRERAWDASAADKRVQDWAGGKDSMDWAKYGKAFFYVDSANKELLGSYKLGFADVIDGELVAIPRGIFAVAAVLQGSRGGVDIPAADKDAIKSKVSDYYSKIAKKFNDDSIVAPWEGRSKEEPMLEERKAMLATAEKITMTAEVRAMDTTDGSLRIGGYAATFNSEADGLSFREIIAPGAFTRALQSADPVFLLVNHDMEGIPLASTQSGTLQLRQDKTGLYMEAELDPANPKAQELTSALKRGDMNKMSFAFTVQPEGQTREGGLRTIEEIDRLFEVSVVTLPAYSSTSVGMRSAEEENLDIAKKKLALKVKQHSLRNRKG